MEHILHYSKINITQPCCLKNVNYNSITHGFMEITNEVNKTTCYKYQEQLKKISGNKFYDKYNEEDEKLEKSIQRKKEKKSIRENNKLILTKMGYY